MSYEIEDQEEIEFSADAQTESPAPVSADRSQLALQMLKQVRHSLTHVIQLLEDGDTSRATRQMVNFIVDKKHLEQTVERETGSRIIEGVFDGVGMVSAEGTRYSVPENYASKSRLVEGDMMKLIVRPDGSHVFKQIGPVERKRIVGILGTDSTTGSPIVMSDEGVHNILTASISYFKGVQGDEVVILIPGNGKSAWAALERIIAK